MNINYLLIHYGTLTAAILRIISCIELLVFCIPLQLKEIRVVNGLKKLRIQLLSFGIILFIVNAVTTYTMFDIVFHTRIQSELVISFQLFNALAFNVLAIIGHLMYTSQYNEKSLEHHIKVEKLEQEQEQNKQK